MADKTEVEIATDFMMKHFLKLAGCYVLVFALFIGSIFYGAHAAFQILQGEVEKVESK